MTLRHDKVADRSRMNLVGEWFDIVEFKLLGHWCLAANLRNCDGRHDALDIGAIVYVLVGTDERFLPLLLWVLYRHCFILYIIAILFCFLCKEHFHFEISCCFFRRLGFLSYECLPKIVSIKCSQVVKVSVKELEHFLELMHLLFKMRFENSLVSCIPQTVLIGRQSHAYKRGKWISLNLILGWHQLDMEL